VVIGYILQIILACYFNDYVNVYKNQAYSHNSKIWIITIERNVIISISRTDSYMFYNKFSSFIISKKFLARPLKKPPVDLFLNPRLISIIICEIHMAGVELQTVEDVIIWKWDTILINCDSKASFARFAYNHNYYALIFR
jgi:hypothetical protein